MQHLNIVLSTCQKIHDLLSGRDWVRGFLKRHPSIAFRNSQSVSLGQAQVSEQMIRNWHAGFKAYLEKEYPQEAPKILSNPTRLWGADESGFPFCPKTQRVLAPKGTRHVYQVQSGSKEQITVMVCFNAMGQYQDPFIIYPGKRMRHNPNEDFPEAHITMTESGWMNQDSFYEFLEEYDTTLTELQIKRPVVFFLDWHSSHVSLKASQFCRDNQIIMYMLLSSATHIIQPGDVGIFGPLKGTWRMCIKMWQMDHLGESFTKASFAGVFKKAYTQVATFKNAAGAFERSGLFPFNANNIDYRKCGTAKVYLPALEKSPASSEATPETSPSTSSVSPSLPESGTNPACPSSSATDSGSQSDVVPGSSPSDDTQASEETNQEVALETPRSSRDDKQPEEDTPSTLLLKLPSIANGSVGDAFKKLRVPEIRRKPKRNTLKKKLPFALISPEALAVLEKKNEEDALKEEKKKQREAEKAAKLLDPAASGGRGKGKGRGKGCSNKAGKENVPTKRKAAAQKGNSQKRAKKGKATVVSDSESEADDQRCAGCLSGEGANEEWVACEICERWYHMECCEDEVLMSLESADDIASYCYICPICFKK